MAASFGETDRFFEKPILGDESDIQAQAAELCVSGYVRSPRPVDLCDLLDADIAVFQR